jgi:hypothetical protein
MVASLNLIGHAAIRREDLRSSYFATRQDYYHSIDLLMRLNSAIRRRLRGAALQTSERVHARGMLESWRKPTQIFGKGWTRSW